MTNDSSIMIYKDRYEFKKEGVEGTLKRVAKHVALNEEEEKMFYDVMSNGYFLPAGRTITNSGIGKDLTLNNCFNANHVPDSIDGIFEYVKLGARTHQKGGGIGYDWSKIRPKGTPTSNEAVASGVVSFMEVTDAQTKTILQGNRRGANMGVLNIYHPDIFDFLDAKSYDEGKLTQFNISIMVDDAFMNAVESNKKVFLHFPVYDENSMILTDESQWTHKQEVDARELWDLIVKKAYDTGEYGVLFYDNLNKDNPTNYIETIVSSNPCGEYVSGTIRQAFINKLNSEKYLSVVQEDFKGACNLGSLHLHRFVKHPFTDAVTIDYSMLKEAIDVGVRMLDNIIDKNMFPDKSYEHYQKNFRTIGLGITGLHNVLSMFGYQYGDKRSVEFVDDLMNFITYNAYMSSVELAKEKGAFNFFDEIKYPFNNFISKHVSGEYGYEWLRLQEEIEQHGIRNARIMSVAPVGTMSLTFGDNCSSGLEPTFMNSMQRKVKFGGQSEEHAKMIEVRDYAYNKWVELHGKDKEYPYKTAMELTVDDHLAILKTVAYYVDMSVSKTVNVPTEYSFEDTKELYKNAWKSGIKGITIFRPNELRQGIFNVKDEEKETEMCEDTEIDVNTLEWGTVIQSSDDLIGRKKKITTGCGSLHIHGFFDPITGKLMEVFFNKGGSGGCFGYAGGLSRMISLALRTGATLNFVVDQLTSVQGCPSYVTRTKLFKDTGRGTNCSSAIGYVLKDMQADVLNELHDNEDYFEERKVKLTLPIATFNEENKNNTIISNDLNINDGLVNCPDCGEHAYNNADGCGFCTSCGYSKCN